MPAHITLLHLRLWVSAAGGGNVLNVQRTMKQLI
jgi:hypothetical protein